MTYDYAVIGAGNAGRTAVETLVDRNVSGTILLVDAESYLPYKRTQVSKKATEGFETEAFAIHDSEWYSDNRVDLVTGEQVDRLDTESRTFSVNGRLIRWKKLLLATGARPSGAFDALPKGRYTELWTKDNALTLHREVPGIRNAVVVGNGVLGIEAAWQLLQAGCEVTVIGKAPRPMARYLDAPCAAELQNAATDAGINLVCDTTVESINESGDDLIVRTDNGEYKAGYLVLAAGSNPLVALASSAGIDVDRGIRVAEDLTTSAPDVWAAGDCAEHPDGTVTGLWHSAEHQGNLAALGMMGEGVRNTNPPYRLKCEVFGGLWFSAGDVNAVTGGIHPKAAEDWRHGDVLWRPRFQDGRIVSLAGSAPGGLAKEAVKAAGRLVLDGAGIETCRSVLVP